MSILKGGPQAVNYLSFDGVDDWVEVNDVSINGGSLTVESWAKIISVDRTIPLFDSRDTGFIQARNTLSDLKFRFYGSSGSTETSNVNISSYANSYHYYSYTYNASDNQFYFYVDGVELLNETINVTLPSNTINAVIGNQHQFLGDTPMQAEIKETRVWDVYRTPSEIQQNHSKYLTGNENGLIVYYDYTEGSGTTLVDKAGNNNGTIVSATWASETVTPAIENIYYGSTEVPRVYLGETFLYGQAPFYTLNIDSTKVDSTLTDFPVMVKANSTNYDMSLLTDNNVYFTDDSDNLLDFEVEYATASERIYHVRIPSVSSSGDTTFKLKHDGSGYGSGRNATSVWSNGYELVTHMSSNLFDSTGKRTLTNNGTNVVTGLNGDGRSFLNDDIKTNYGRTLDDFTLMAVFKRTSINTSSNENALICNFEAPSNEWTRISVEPNDYRFYIDNNGNREGIQAGTPISNTYNYLAGTRNSNVSRLYLNGNLIGSNTSVVTGLITSDENFNFGSRGDNANEQFFYGDMDEVRISSVERNSSWVKAEYNNLFNTLISNVTIT